MEFFHGWSRNKKIEWIRKNASTQSIRNALAKLFQPPSDTNYAYSRMDDVHPFPIFMEPHMVRIGTIPDGSCFYHTILRAISNLYFSKTKKKRQIHARQFRKKMQEKMTLDVFHSLGNGQVALSKTLEVVRPYLDMLYPDEKVMDTIIDNKAKSYNEWEHKLIQTLQPILEPENQYMLKPILDQAHVLAYSQFIEEIGEEYASNDVVEFVSNEKNIDIYFVDAHTHEPYRTADDCSIIYKHRPSIFILYLNRHYELLGRPKADGTFTIKFSPRDPLVLAYYRLLCS